MSWELYEVWSVDQDGYEELVDTTRSIKEAQALAKSIIADGATSVLIYKDIDGVVRQVDRLTGTDSSVG